MSLHLGFIVVVFANEGRFPARLGYWGDTLALSCVGLGKQGCDCFGFHEFARLVEMIHDHRLWVDAKAVIN